MQEDGGRKTPQATTDDQRQGPRSRAPRLAGKNHDEHHDEIPWTIFPHQ